MALVEPANYGLQGTLFYTTSSCYSVPMSYIIARSILPDTKIPEL